MTTSINQNFSRNRNQACLGALGKIGVYGIGRTPSAEDMQLTSDTLNMMIKAWAAKGLHLWEKEEAVMFVTQYTSSYTIGSESGDAYCCLAADLTTTQLTTNIAQSATTLLVLSTSNMTIGDYIGIVMADNSLQWSTISSIPSSTSVIITNPLNQIAPASNLVFSFTNKIYKPLRILNAQWVDGFDNGQSSTQTERYLDIISYQDYQQLQDKTTNGDVNQVSYLPRNTNGNLYVYPRPDNCTRRIQFTYERIIDDLDTLTDDFDMPSEWMECIIWQLALRIAPDFGAEDRANKVVAPIAEKLLENLLDWDIEITDIQIRPNRGGYYGRES